MFDKKDSEKLNNAQYDEQDFKAILGALPGKIVIFNESYKIVEVFNGLASNAIRLEIADTLTRSINSDFQTKFIASINRMQQKKGAKYFKEEKRLACVEFFRFKQEYELGLFQVFEASVSCSENNLWLLHICEITEYHLHEEDKERGQIANLAKMSSIGEMAAGVAHEINNPLHIIIGMANKIKKNILQSTGSPEENIDYVARIETTVQRISKIVTGLSQLAQKDSVSEKEDFNLFEMISEVLKINGEKYFSEGISVTTVMDEQLCMKGRRIQLSQVLMNYLDNAYDAVKFLENPWIEIRVVANGAIIKLSVVDSGNGISKNIINKVFDPFFTTKPLGKGTGLGTSISKQIIEAHNGKVGYELVSGHTSFYFEVPCQ